MIRPATITILLPAILAGLLPVEQARGTSEPAPVILIASKPFTESLVLGEMLTQLVRDAGARAVHKRALGGTRIALEALAAGNLAAYVEYTGTITEEIFAVPAHDHLQSWDDIRGALRERGILISEPLGFNNTYVLGMKEKLAERLGVQTISDLANHPDLRFGFSNEFMNRGDGWPSLKNRYDLPQRWVRGMQHDLAYRGLEGGDIHVIDLYSTDAEIEYYNIRRLIDDRGHFPEYSAVILYRAELPQRAPEVVASMLRLEGALDEDTMTALNHRAKLDRVPIPVVAADFLDEQFGIASEVRADTIVRRLAKHTTEHLFLVGISLTAAILVAVPLGIAAALGTRIGQFILGCTGIIQTIPSLALLVFMIPLFGLGAAPAIAALFLYSLLPIVRNTYTGLRDIPGTILESADALGLPRSARMVRVELPLAASSILAGIKTSAVINVGTATLGGFIAAGGYGQLIFDGLMLDNMSLIFQGAIPAALLALLVQGFFDLLDRVVVPRGLRLKPETAQL